MSSQIYDCVVVGGGPAGLSAALLLGRCVRRVLVCDSGQYRNACVTAMHGVLGLDGIDPAELRARGRAQLSPYETVEVVDGAVRQVSAGPQGCFVAQVDDRKVAARTLIVATGIVDQLPKIDGFGELYGCAVHVCPYCDAWEHRGKPMAVYGRGARGAGLALMLRHWSEDIVLLTDGPDELEPATADRLAACKVGVRHERVIRIEGRDRQLEAIVLDGGKRLSRSALFFNTGQRQRSSLLEALGCGYAENGGVACGLDGDTSVPGVYVAGDASRDVQMAIVAAAEGARAAIAVNRRLLREDGLIS